VLLFSTISTIFEVYDDSEETYVKIFLGAIASEGGEEGEVTSSVRCIYFVLLREENNSARIVSETRVPTDAAVSVARVRTSEVCFTVASSLRSKKRGRGDEPRRLTAATDITPHNRLLGGQRTAM
jgi:hypothetical protein